MIKNQHWLFITWRMKLKFFILSFKALLVLTSILWHIFFNATFSIRTLTKPSTVLKPFNLHFSQDVSWSFTPVLLPKAFLFSRNVLPLSFASFNYIFPARKRKHHSLIQCVSDFSFLKWFFPNMDVNTLSLTMYDTGLYSCLTFSV